MSRETPVVLIVDDEPDLCQLLEMTLARMKLSARSVHDLAQAKEQLKQHRYQLCLSDLRLPDGDGIELVEFIQENHPGLPVAVITAHGNMATAISALKAGAFDFVNKPIDLPVLRKLVKSALSLTELGVTPPPESTLAKNQLIGSSPAINELKKTILKVSRSQAPVAISGQSGTGKELAARLIHQSGPRSDKPFIPVNCGSVPEQLLESEFFGHLKGSFTGATTDKEGLFAAANGGTLFLDEVAELPLHMQVKLLRALQEKKVRPIGAREESPVDVRIISATHQDLNQLVKNGKFRQDLFYRINVIELNVPSLRERKTDIPLLVEHLMGKLFRELERVEGPASPAVAADAMEALVNYPYPGNVRELENILARALALCEGEEIHAKDLQLPQPEIADIDQSADLDGALEELERERIIRALEENRFNKTATAKQLGISFRALRYRLKKLEID